MRVTNCTGDTLTLLLNTNLAIFWQRGASLNDAASLEAPEVIAAEMIEDLQTALDEIAQIYADLAPVEDDLVIS